MSRLYRDARGNQIRLDALLGKGGEANVYTVKNSASHLAKIYHDPVSMRKARKLEVIPSLSSSQLIKFSAWPESPLYDANSNSVSGTLMPRISGSVQLIHELYNPASRKEHFPQATWGFLVRTARNCAAAFAKLHEAGVVVGDVNQGNLFVDSNALVYFIDCDSFQILSSGDVYHCEVGVPHFTPPELHGCDFTKVVRSPNHDSFGLAILIFHLLFMGRHPFVGRYRGHGDMPIERAIREGRFAYAISHATSLMQPPPHALTLADLPRPVADLFTKAFTQSNRPSAKEWVSALGQLESLLATCSDDWGHLFVRGQRVCPWCAIFQKGGPDFFDTVAVSSAGYESKQFDISQAWREINAISPISHSSIADLRALLPRPQPQLLSCEDPFGLLRRLTGAAAIGGAILSALSSLAAPLLYPGLGLVAVFSVWWYVLLLQRRSHSPETLVRHELDIVTREFATAAARYEELYQQHLHALTEARQGFDSIRCEWDQLDSEEQKEVDSISKQTEHQQRNSYLSQHFVAHAQIDGLGDGRLAVLESYGIETALDVTETKVRNVPGFGRKLAKRLCAWRIRVENGFRYDPARGIPRATRQAIAAKYVRRRQRLHQQLQRGPKELQRVVQSARAPLDQAYSAAHDAMVELLQAEANERALRHLQ
ncbi:hypothetical protein [Aeoliella sp. SH292]|uniref:hypothetical protein n=1 Tax=Aeoliella sp. SH292 TaxID=3454464 RepID=UPI003F9A386D